MPLHEIIQPYLFYSQKQRDELIYTIPLLREPEITYKDIEEKTTSPNEYKSLLSKLNDGNLSVLKDLEILDLLYPDLFTKFEKDKAHTKGLEIYLDVCNKVLSEGHLNTLDNSFAITFKRIKFKDTFPFDYLQAIHIINQAYIIGEEHKKPLTEDKRLDERFYSRVIDFKDINAKKYK